MKQSDPAWLGNALILTWFIFRFSLLSIPKETFQASPHLGGVQSICPRSELADGSFDNGIPRFVISVEYSEDLRGRGDVPQFLPIELSYEFSVNHLLG